MMWKQMCISKGSHEVKLFPLPVHSNNLVGEIILAMWVLRPFPAQSVSQMSQPTPTPSTMCPKPAPYGTWHSPITSEAIVQNVSNELISTQETLQPYLITTLAGDQDLLDLHRPQHIRHLSHRSSSQRGRQMCDC